MCMPSLESFSCEHCGTEFEALSGGNAAVRGYCSPSCETEGRGLD